MCRPTSKAATTDSVQILVRITPGVEYVKVVLMRGRVIGALLIGETDLEVFACVCARARVCVCVYVRERERERESESESE